MPWFLWSKSSDYDDSDDDYDSSDTDHQNDDDESYDSTTPSTPSIATTSVENMKTNDNKDNIDLVQTSQHNSDTYNMERKTGSSEGSTSLDREDDNDSMLNDVEFQGLILGNSIPSILETQPLSSSRYRAESELSTDLIDDVTKSPNKYNQSDRDHVNDIASTIDESNDNMDVDKDDDNQNQQEEDDDDGTTSFEEKQSVLALAAEHDRVDIIQAILGTNNNSPNSNNNITPSKNDDVDMEGAAAAVSTTTTNTPSNENLEVGIATTKSSDVTDSTTSDDDEQRSERDRLLNPINTGIPPLHIAISYGSLGAVSCLLRMGADPSLRPNSNRIQEYYKRQQNNINVDNESTTAPPPMTPIKNISRFDNMSAWELVFGSSNDNNSISSTDQSSRWSFTANNKKTKTIIDLSSTKKDGIRHSFTAEALRCIGSDEVERLHHLLNAGMPSTIELGNKPLYLWAIDLNATQCQELLRPADQKAENDEEIITNIPTNGNVVVDGQRTSAVLDRTNNNNNEECTYQQLRNKYNELESLSIALSSCLENLAEEVSVCSGLLLVGKGASALATHVRSLKSMKDKKYNELLQLESVYENTLDELSYWIEEKCSQYISQNDIQEQLLQTLSNTDATTAYLTSVTTKDPPAVGAVSNGNGNHKGDAIQPNESSLTNDDDQNELEIQQRYQLTAKILTCENKIRQLRASITDLSDENVRNLNEVERRGLSGGILLVRNIRNEIRELEYYYNELHNDETICRAKISMAQHFYFTKKNNDNNKLISNAAVSPVEIHNGDNGGSTEQQPQDSFQLLQSSAISNLSRLESMELIRSDSTDMVDFHQNEQSHRRLFALWQIILRIIGLRSTTNNNTMTQPFSDSSWIVGSTTSYGKKSSQMSRPVMIV